MNRFVRAASIATVLIAGSLASGAARAQHINVPFQAANGYTYVWDRAHCLYIWTQQGWSRQGCHSPAQAQAHSNALIGDIQNRLRAQIQAQQQANAAAAQRRANGTCITGIDPGCISIQHPQVDYGNSPRGAGEWVQGPPQYRR